MTRSEVNITWAEIGKHEILLIKCVFHKIWSSDFQKKAAFRFLKQNPLRILQTRTVQNAIIRKVFQYIYTCLLKKTNVLKRHNFNAKTKKTTEY